MKIKLRDMTEEQYMEWKEEKDCYNSKCDDCLFDKVVCSSMFNGCWVVNKDLYSDKFLDQEIETEPILTNEEREYLSAVIKPFRDKIEFIIKYTLEVSGKEYIEIELENDCLVFPSFKAGTYYKGMELNEEYTLEELGL